MDLCLIPPIPHLRQFPQKRHLLLSHLLTDSNYREYYIDRGMKGDFLILDNSAHENGIGEGAEKLLLQALNVGASEIVVPDALENAEKTVYLGEQALRTWRQDIRLKMMRCSLMFVPQGKELTDWKWCLHHLLRLYKEMPGARPGITIGISKDYYNWKGGLATLVQVTLNALKQEDVEAEIHMLGVNHDYWTVGELRAAFPMLRSVDTAKPFVWAREGLIFHSDDKDVRDISEFPSRPPDYFQRRLTNHELERANRNAALLRRMVEA
jgi:hypothetical protein